MSRIFDTLKNKSKIERVRRQRQKEEINSIKNKTIYKAALANEFKKIDILLDSFDIRSVEIEISDKMLNSFTEAMYSNELAGYDIRQMPENPNRFIIRYKEI
ncbi:MAG: hypothetical protein IJ593_10710 [Lachnospiraceae bacterium]|nr:hypothetical protein [Lachnospiraceae bacterium]